MYFLPQWKGEGGVDKKNKKMQTQRGSEHCIPWAARAFFSHPRLWRISFIINHVHPLFQSPRLLTNHHIFTTSATKAQRMSYGCYLDFFFFFFKPEIMCLFHFCVLIQKKNEAHSLGIEPFGMMLQQDFSLWVDYLVFFWLMRLSHSLESKNCT